MCHCSLLDDVWWVGGTHVPAAGMKVLLLHSGLPMHLKESLLSQFLRDLQNTAFEGGEKSYLLHNLISYNRAQVEGRINIGRLGFKPSSFYFMALNVCV